MYKQLNHYKQQNWDSLQTLTKANMFWLASIIQKANNTFKKGTECIYFVIHVNSQHLQSPLNIKN